MRNMKRRAGPVLDRPFYSPKDVARLAGVHPSTVISYIRSGRLYGLRLSERVYRIPVRAVAKLLEPERVRAPRLLERPLRRIDVAAFERELAKEHRKRPRRA